MWETQSVKEIAQSTINLPPTRGKNDVHRAANPLLFQPASIGFRRPKNL